MIKIFQPKEKFNQGKGKPILTDVNYNNLLIFCNFRGAWFELSILFTCIIALLLFFLQHSLVPSDPTFSLKGLISRAHL